MPVARIRGANVSYEDHGKGVTVVMVHGHPFDGTMWDPQVEALASRYRLVVPDLRGYGKTTVPDGVTLLDEAALDLAHLMDHLEIERAVVCGLSMGGQIAMELAWLFPQRLIGLVLCDTDARSETTQSRAARLKMADELESEGMAPYVDTGLPNFLHELTIQGQPDVVAHMRRMMLDAPAQGAASLQRGRAERRDHLPLLANVDVPSLVVVGDTDFFTPVETARQIADAIPNAEFAVVPNTGHMPNLEAPSDFNEVLEAFLEKANR